MAAGDVLARKADVGRRVVVLTRLPHEKLGGSSTRVPSHIGDPLRLRRS